MALADAQFSMSRLLKPFTGFEEIYQGVSGEVPVAFPGGLAPEAQRGIPGYVNNLQAGWPVPIGSRVVLWIPLCLGKTPGNLQVFAPYRYKLVWRLRSPVSGALKFPPRPPYLFHNPKPGLGAANTAAPGDPRFYPIPAAFNSIAFEQTEPSAATTEAVSNIRSEVFDLVANPTPLPNGYTTFGPTGVSLDLQQGIWDPAFKAFGVATPAFFPIQTDAEGDELVILAQKIPDGEGSFGTWDFAGDDLPFSFTYGDGNGTYQAPYDDAGIYILTGSNP